MLELIQITNDPAFARRCDDLGGFRIFVDLERLGKAERQAGRNTFISVHTMEDIAPVKAVLRRTPLMVRVNPLHEGTRAEVEAVIGEGADTVMLPIFRTAAEVAEFAGIVAGRLPIVTLLETREALESLSDWASTPGIQEIYVGLNDLHLSLGCRFMFEPLANGMVEQVANVAKARGRRFGFGGVARLDEGQLHGRRVLGEHLRLGSGAVVLSRTFHRPGEGDSFEDEVGKLRDAETELRARSPSQVKEDAVETAALIERIAASMPPAR